MSALTDQRPWGHYTVLADEEDHKVKRIVVQPGKRLSLQRHQHRAEHWYVVKGEARVTLDESKPAATLEKMTLNALMTTLEELAETSSHLFRSVTEKLQLRDFHSVD